MNAWVLHAPNDLRMEEREIPKPKQGEALLEVKAAGVCGSDIPRIYQTGAHVHPIVPGHEFSGVVTQSADPDLIGKRVGVFPLIPCFQCDMCRQKRHEMCRSYNYLGSRCDGGFAEYVSVPEWNLIELPDGVSFEQAACLEPLSVAVHAIQRANVAETDTVAVIGLGTIGLFVTALLAAKGVKKLCAIGNKPFQEKKALELGATDYMDCLDVRETKVSADVVFECVGKSEAAALTLDCAAPGGRVVMVGNPAEDMSFPRDTYWKILRNQLSVFGTWNSSFTHEETDDWHEALRFLAEHGSAVSRIITHRFFLDELEKGLRIMRDKTEPYAKVMIKR